MPAAEGHAEEVLMDVASPSVARVLPWLPRHIAADFDCPDRGPHEFVSVSSAGRTWTFCKHCPAKRVTRD